MFFFVCTNTIATPHYPNGIPAIAPLKGGNTFWGKTTEGEYFEGTGYGANYKIRLPTGQILALDISAQHISHSGQSGRKRTHSFTIQNNIKNFSGDFDLCILNPNKEVIKKKYKGALNVPDTGTYFTHYQAFDFAEAKENAKIALELILNDGKTRYVPVDNQTAKEWIFIADSFPDIE